MTLALTTDTLRTAYEFLSTTPPFRDWNLPDGDDVRFRVVRNSREFAWHNVKDGQHIIAVSERLVGHTSTLLMTMAHEIIHLHQAHCGMETPGNDHNEAFGLLAEDVCRHHGFDPKAF